MRRTLLIALTTVALLAGGTYYYLYGKKFVYRFTQADLQAALSTRLPLERTYLFMVHVTLDNPRVVLIEGSDRVNAGLDITLNIRVGESPIPVTGSVDASGGIRYEPNGGQFFLTAPRIERLDLKGVPEKYASRASSALSVALGEYYATHPVYTLNTINAKQAAAKLTLQSVIVEHQQLVVTLGIGP